MGDGIKVRFEYGGVRLICDDAALARLYEHIGKEASVAEVLGRAWRPCSVRFVSVGPPAPASPGIRWVDLVTIALAGGFSGVVFIVGPVTIIQWAMRQLT
jgi:hypothetical protein